MTPKGGFLMFFTYVHANHVHRRKDDTAVSSTNPLCVRKVMSLAQDQNIRNNIVRSIALSIHIHRQVKTDLVISMFGVVAKYIK